MFSQLSNLISKLKMCWHEAHLHSVLLISFGTQKLVMQSQNLALFLTEMAFQYLFSRAPISLVTEANLLMLQNYGVTPFSVHVNYNEGGLKGKRHRMREAGLWLDAPSYFESPNGFVQVGSSEFLS